MNNNVKSATVAGLLGIFLGSVGAHDWYLGNKTKGIIHVCLASSGIVLSIIASVVLPAALSYRALITWGALVSILSLAASLVMFGNGIWGLVEGIIILSQGDAGLARKGYAVATPNMGYGQPMNNNMNDMNNMNGMQGQGNNMQQMNNFGGNNMNSGQNGNNNQNNMQNMNNGGRQNG